MKKKKRLVRLLVHLELRRQPSVRREGGQLTKTEGDQCLAERGEGTRDSAYVPAPFSRQMLAARL